MLNKLLGKRRLCGMFKKMNIKNKMGVETIVCATIFLVSRIEQTCSWKHKKDSI